jgi:hypothetical protein
VIERRMASVLVSLDYRPIASYSGGAPGLAPTSPSVTGQRLGSGSPAEQAYEKYVAAIEQEFESALAAAIREARITQRLRVVYGGVAVTLPADRIDDLRTLVHVVDVQPDRQRHLNAGIPPPAASG